MSAKENGHSAVIEAFWISCLFAQNEFPVPLLVGPAIHRVQHLERSKHFEHFWRCYSFSVIQKKQELVQSIVSNYYRAATSQGNWKVCRCIKKLSTPSTIRQVSAKETLFNHSCQLTLTNMNYILNTGDEIDLFNKTKYIFKLELMSDE